MNAIIIYIIMTCMFLIVLVAGIRNAIATDKLRQDGEIVQVDRKESLDMSGRKQRPLDSWLLIALLLIVGFFAYRLLSSTILLWHGVATKGVIVTERPIYCAKSGMRNTFSVQFTDQTGQAQTSSISQCDFADFNASPGDSVSMVYLPEDPTEIAPPDSLLANARFDLIGVILGGLVTLILLSFWITKRIRKASQQDRPELREPSTEQIQQDRPEPSAKRSQQKAARFLSRDRSGNVGYDLMRLLDRWMGTTL